MYLDPLEAKLIENNWVSREELLSAREEAARIKKPLWVCLEKLGFLSLEDLCVFFAQESGVPYVKISDYKINPEALAALEEGFCRQNLVIPLFKTPEALFAACANPLDTALIDNMARLAQCPVEPLISPAKEIIKALDGYYGSQDKTLELGELITKQPPLAGLPFWRESERLSLNIPVSLYIEDLSIASPCCLPIESRTRDISRNGAALGLEILLFLPRTTKVLLEFKPPAASTVKAKGEIVYCRMEKGKRYFLGIKFSGIDEEAKTRLFGLAGPRP